ncbi:Alpha/beta hydrolase family protein [Paenibacillus algorifonticola]|uniref:Alpha/beta hydrolase family protein n=1 Tax=Paenibacillus algorifonticola TaxID=684063 RepID=A0A1I2IP90_9BACL|nr:alpha/beta fold hydrolase [Paenibacillus algorifonticola]SFF44232.1 Alpha/beta hydrolase family protein [Paenibacillus algorifonticola]
MAHLFVTGGTGFIGQRLLQTLAQTKQHATVLVRSLSKYEQLLDKLNLRHNEFIKPVCGDLTQPLLGLNKEDLARVKTAEVMIHAGGPMDIRLSAEQAKRVFLQASQHMAEIASLIHAETTLRHFIHLVGFKSPFRNEDLSQKEQAIASLSHEPPYEQAKFHADLHMREQSVKHGYPLSVVHPGVVIGDSATGETEQLGGLGLLVEATRRKLMALVPGGEKYWLPLFHLDHAAAFIAALAQEEHPVSQTYYLLQAKEDSPNMMGLITTMAKELRVAKPVGALPLGILSKVLSSPLGGKLGIPQESLSFVVNDSYSLESARHIQQKYALDYTVTPSTLRHTIADLDFRLSHSVTTHKGYNQGKLGNMTALRNNNSGNPVLFIPGTFSGADCLIPLANHFHNADIWLPDLPGLGRSPYHHKSNVIDGHAETLIEAIAAMDTPVTLIGHSYGALLAAKVMEAMPDRIQALGLLQPVFHPAPSMYKQRWLTEMALSRMSETALIKSLIKQSCFQSEAQIPAEYIRYVQEELRSPRVRKTLAELLRELTRPQSFQLAPEQWDEKKVHILWGEQERNYELPDRYRHLKLGSLPYGHHFPISHPEQTAQLLRQRLEL